MKDNIKPINLKDSTARTLYKSASPELKTILEENYGRDFFNQKMRDIVTSLDQVYEITKFSPKNLPYERPKEKYQRAANAFVNIGLITEVFNQGRVLDWSNTNQEKYYPRFIKKGSVWVVGDFYGWGDCRAVLGFGSYYATSEDALYAANTFIDVYRDYLPD